MILIGTDRVKINVRKCLLDVKREATEREKEMCLLWISECQSYVVLS